MIKINNQSKNDKKSTSKMRYFVYRLNLSNLDRLKVSVQYSIDELILEFGVITYTIKIQ